MAITKVSPGLLDLDSGITITTADNTAQLQLISTDADANSGPQLDLYRNSGSPADGDDLGRIYFYGENDADQKIEMVLMRASIVDASDSSEDSSFQLYTYVGGSQADRLTLNSTETVFNESSKDVDFRVESNGNANMLFVDGGNDVVTIGGSTFETADTFSVTDSGANSVNTRLVNTNADANGVKLILEKNSSSPADNDELGEIAFLGRDDAGNANTFAAIRVFADDVSNGTEDGIMTFSTLKAGSFTEHMRIQPTGYVAVGTNSPASPLHVSGNFQVNTTTADSNENRFKVVPGGAGDNCTVQIIQDDASTVGVYLQADGPSWFTGGINPGSGDTTAANVLDDYEEGTWTPSLRAGSSALTISYANGPTARYTKIGRMVHVHLGFRLSSVSGTSGTVLRIYGLPYANISTGGYQEDRLSAFLAHNPTADHSGNIFGFVGNGTSYIEFRYLDGGDTVLPSNGLDSDTAMSVYGIYYTSS